MKTEVAGAQHLAAQTRAAQQRVSSPLGKNLWALQGDE